MSRRYVFKRFSICPKCLGSGVVEHPQWEECISKIEELGLHGDNEKKFIEDQKGRER